MSDLQKGLLVIAGAFLLGMSLGGYLQRRAHESNMIENGAAHYDSKTGELVHRQFKGVK